MTADIIADTLAARREALSPRFSPPSVPLASRLIHGGAFAFWVVLLGRGLVGGGGLLAWSVGIAYILYDTVLLAFVFRQTWPLRRASPITNVPAAARPTTTVIVAAHNEAGTLPITIASLLAQTVSAERIVVADDGSTDDTAAMLIERYGLEPAPVGALGAPSPMVPSLHWLRVPHGGKARALNVAAALAETELVLTVDADTLLDPPALAAMRDAFAVDAALMAATGVLKPVCGGSPTARLLQWFQTYEYVRNFLSRFAWMSADGLLLISGAFACYRRDALLAVGGFDPDCLVEDYELIHRLRDHAGRVGDACHTAVIGRAHACTDAPSTGSAFLHQRSRWFGGFLQTQRWYRHMVGDRRYGHTGTMMLPVKAIDTLQPLYGLTGAVLLAAYVVAGRFSLAGAVFDVIGVKLVIDVAFHLWSLRLYRRWIGDDRALAVGPALLAALLEPFSFQLLRHLGAALGWVTFVTGARSWRRAPRFGVMRIRT